MNASRLREVIDLLLEKEQQFKLQEILGELNTHLSNLASNPQEATHQKNFAEAIEKLEVAVEELAASFQPAQIKLLEEIGADEFFTPCLFHEIAVWVQENPISPAVAHQKLSAFVKKRNAFINDITQLRDKLDKMNIKASTLTEGTAEIGVLIPRELFHSHLDELIKELSVINKILRAFAETATGSVQPIEVRDISTSDPLFFFGLDPITTGTVGGVVAWALSQWKKVEEIRKLRSDTKKNPSFSEEEVKAFFDSKIEKTISEAIEQKTADLIKTMKAPFGRDNEKRK